MTVTAHDIERLRTHAEALGRLGRRSLREALDAVLDEWEHNHRPPTPPRALTPREAPMACPVCGGLGYIRSQFVRNDPAVFTPGEECSTCDGLGVIL